MELHARRALQGQSFVGFWLADDLQRVLLWEGRGEIGRLRLLKHLRVAMVLQDQQLNVRQVICLFIVDLDSLIRSKVLLITTELTFVVRV